tara:strand:- start:1589 stop:4567 length:2979 start_codon:yes stop_codon:yes gene_type:complete
VPKEVFKIEGFHGGLNSNSDPRDIRDNESPSLKDVGIDSVGKIKTLGSFDNGNIVHSGNAQSVLASTHIQLASAASDTDDAYNGYSIFITAGTGSPQENKINDYTGSTNTVVLSQAWGSPSNPTGGSSYEIRGDGNEVSIVKNRGLFTMSSDRKIDGNLSNETLIFLYDDGGDTIDVKDSDTWNTAKINMGGNTIPIYYTADGVIRVSDIALVRNSQWFGYISGQKFNGLNAISHPTDADIGWYNVEQSLATPTSGHCLISTPAVGTDSNGIFSSASEYIGNVIDDGGSGDVVDHSAVNLRVGVQLNEIIASGHADWDFNIQQTNDPSSDSTDIYPCIGTAVTQIVGTGSALKFASIGVNGLDYTIGDNQCLIVSIFFTTSEYGDLRKIKVSGGSVTWEFGLDDIKPNMWNLLVCSGDNINSGSENFPIDSSASNFSLFIYDNHPGGGGSTDVTYYVSGVAIAQSQSIDAFQPGVYTFHHTYLYDVEHKQESLPTEFSGVDSGSEPDNVSSINVAGSSVLFNFDAYICSNNASPAYAFNKRISGSRLYYKKEENDNYFLIGELDFVDKGFKFLPEADTLSYTMTNTSDTTAPILSKTALIKGISPETANTIDTFKTINGFSTEVKSLDAKYKTAVVHGRRVYIGNIKRPDGKTHPDRIIKSQVNRFDTFPEGMGSVDVVIRDGESIVKLEAYADRILQFKQHSLYIINVSESVDFLEDTFRNKGCAFDYHVVRIDMGVAWFNDHGCFLYNGKTVLDLLEKQGIRLISEEDWEAFVTDGVDGSADDPDMSSAMIGYVPKKKHLIIKNENNDIYLYDFVLQAWTTGIGKITESTAMTNFALDGDQNLFYIDNTTTIRKTWQVSPQESSNFEYITPDIDFGQSSVRKKIYRVRINYKGDADNLTINYSVNGDTDFPYDFEGTDASTGKPTGSTASSSKPLHDKTDLTQWYQAELKPDVSSESNNIYSFKLRMQGTVDNDFEINDISIIYRLKNVR